MAGTSFLTYELYSKGLVLAKDKPKRRRVTTGCLECKQRKKKCDEKRPICSQCLRHRGAASICTWPQSSTPRLSTPQSSTSEKSTPHTPKAMAASLQQSNREMINSITGNSNDCHSDINQDTVKLFTLLPSFKGISMNAIEKHLFHALTSRSEAITSNTSLLRDFSFSSLLPPLSLWYPVTRSAALACGAVLLANSIDAAWLPIAQYYHTQTIHAIRTSLLRDGGEQNLPAVLLLHLYEELRADSMCPTHMHLAGAQELILLMMDHSWTTATGYQRIMVEVFLYRAAVSSTFISTSPIDVCIDRHSRFLQQSSMLVNGSSKIEHSTILGVPSEIFTNVMALSLLRRCMPLQPPDEIRAVRIYSRLQAYLVANAPGESDLDQPLQLLLTGELYCLACLLFLEKILRPSLQSHDPEARAIIGRALAVWSKFVAADFKSPTIKWPLVILGCGAIEEAEREMFRRPFEVLASLGVGRAQSILSLFDHAWGIALPDQSNIRFLGLNVLLYNDLLFSILV
ncbi:uncharacterized protein PAC_00235 [Phialocephala subalpina]|uniref:Zn(2)-C6 fungal-type domain-containing protein n=1 Tax=Phialocephala subalpina TaxID=576137 RepID=A0A1L7WC42_9HELO|nr:uncharacterized protein PAC_00235 [Phialocephala subalpina]